LPLKYKNNQKFYLMKRYLLSLLILIISLQTTSAQKTAKNYTLKWGPFFKEKSFFDMSILGADPKQIYMSEKLSGIAMNSKVTSRVYYSAFNRKSLTKSKSQKADFKLQKKKMYLDYDVYIDEKIHTFSKFKNKKKKTLELYHQTINKKTLLPNDDRSLITGIDYSNSGWFEIGDFKYSMSLDSTKLLIFKKIPLKRKNHGKFSFTVLNQKIEKLWEKLINVPYEDQFLK